MGAEKFSKNVKTVVYLLSLCSIFPYESINKSNSFFISVYVRDPKIKLFSLAHNIFFVC